jgi:hypothetical protein
MQKPRPVQGIAATEALAALGYTARQGDGDMKDTKPNDPPFDVRALESIERASSGLKLRPEQVAALREGYCATGAQGYTSFGARSAIPAHVADDNEDPHTKTLALHSFTVAELAALIARDADVRTLDQADPQWGMAREEPRSYCVLRINGETVTHGAAFPDEARAKAAAWVRSTTRDSP